MERRLYYLCYNIRVYCTRALRSPVQEKYKELRSLFARFGLPEMVVTDNGTCFVSAEFEQETV